MNFAGILTSRLGFGFLLLITLSTWDEKAFSQACSMEDIVNMKKSALVIGESGYKKGALAHTINDARDMTDSLRKIRFTVYPYFDLEKAGFEDAIDKWIASLSGQDVALFYFSGHGLEQNNAYNFLFPIDANPKGETDLAFQCVLANSIMERMAQSGVKYCIFILDACRDNPFSKGWPTRSIQDEGGLSAMSGSGTYIAFAAAPNHTASDGEEKDRNGVFTGAILKYITKANKTIDDLFTDVAAEVMKKSAGSQSPYRQSTLTAKYCFAVAEEVKSIRPSAGISQSASQLALNRTEEEFVGIDNKSKTIGLFDANSFSIIGSRSFSGNYSQVLFVGADYLAVLDSSGRKVWLLNTPTLDSIGTIKIPGKAISMAGYPGNGIFVAYRDSLDDGHVAELDLLSKSIKKDIPCIASPSAIALSHSGRNLYVISNSKKSGYALFDLDTKTYRSRLKSSIAGGKGIGVTPDDRRLYVSCDTSTGQTETNVIDTKSLDIVDRLAYPAKNITFSSDGKYAFLTNDIQTSIIKNDGGILVNELPYFHSSEGLATTENGKIIVWIPDEHRPILLSLEEQTRKKNVKVQDPRVQDFNKAMDRALRNQTDSIARRAFTVICDSVQKFTDTFSNQLSGKYYYAGSSQPEIFVDNDSAVFSFGFRSTLESRKQIYGIFCAVYIRGNIRVELRDNQVGNDIIQIDHLFRPEQFEWNILRAYIEEYYKARLNRVRFAEK